MRVVLNIFILLIVAELGFTYCACARDQDVDEYEREVQSDKGPDGPRAPSLRVWSDKVPTVRFRGWLRDKASALESAVKNDDPCKDVLQEFKQVLVLMLQSFKPTKERDKLLSTSAPADVWALYEDGPEDGPPSPAYAASHMNLTATEKAVVLRMGVAVKFISPEALANFLAKDEDRQLLRVYAETWMSGWVSLFLASRQDVFGPKPGDWFQLDRTKNLWMGHIGGHAPVEKFRRKAGEAIYSSMQSFLCDAITLRGVEPGGVQRLLEEFAHVLSANSEMQLRFQQVLLPEQTRRSNKNVDSKGNLLPLEDLIFLAMYKTLILNSALGQRPKDAETKTQFTKNGMQTCGMHGPVFAKIYDALKNQLLKRAS